MRCFLTIMFNWKGNNTGKIDVLSDNGARIHFAFKMIDVSEIKKWKIFIFSSHNLKTAFQAESLSTFAGVDMTVMMYFDAKH